jgi:hypothetical protein
MNMQLYTNVHMYICVSICMYECVCKSKGVRRRIELQGPIDWYVYMCIYVCLCVFIYLYVCMYVCMYEYMYIFEYVII